MTASSLVTDTSSLLLLNDTLNDYVGSQGGMIQVDGTARRQRHRRRHARAADHHHRRRRRHHQPRRLQHRRPARGRQRHRQHSSRTSTPPAGTFTNDGELLGDRHQQPAAAQRHAERLRRQPGRQDPGRRHPDGSGTGGATLELQNTTIDGGGAITNPAVFNIDGLLKADNATANTIENFDRRRQVHQ